MRECLYSCLRYPACKSHLLCVVWYCNLWHVWLYHTFTHSNKHHIHKEFTENKMCVFTFSATLWPSHFQFWEESSKVFNKCRSTYIGHREQYRYAGQILVKLEIFFDRKKSSNRKFPKNPSIQRPAVPCGRTVMHYGANSRFSQNYERTQNAVHLWRQNCRNIQNSNQTKRHGSVLRHSYRVTSPVESIDFWASTVFWYSKRSYPFPMSSH
jgi:hypothetical protein